MAKKLLKLSLVIIIILFLLLIILFNYSFKSDNQIIIYDLEFDSIYNDESKTCYDDGMSYIKDLNITVSNIEYEKIFFFYRKIITYIEGDLCSSEYIMSDTEYNNILNSNYVLGDYIDFYSLIGNRERLYLNKIYNCSDSDNYYTRSYQEIDNYVYVVYTCKDNEDNYVISLIDENEMYSPKYAFFK